MGPGSQGFDALKILEPSSCISAILKLAFATSSYFSNEPSIRGKKEEKIKHKKETAVAQRGPI